MLIFLFLLLNFWNKYLTFGWIWLPPHNLLIIALVMTWPFWLKNQDDISLPFWPCVQACGVCGQVNIGHSFPSLCGLLLLDKEAVIPSLKSKSPDQNTKSILWERPSEVYIRPNNIYTGPSDDIHPRQIGSVLLFHNIHVATNLDFPERLHAKIFKICALDLSIWSPWMRTPQHHHSVAPQTDYTNESNADNTQACASDLGVRMIMFQNVANILLAAVKDAFLIQLPTILNTGTYRRRETLH